ncbi:MAG: hypothetical protein EAX96_06730 [Candidatus Lokiarchaeota archaeon]|nr:hypothetical protein [Candidatus Lokiarchaeota archaeon]
MSKREVMEEIKATKIELNNFFSEFEQKMDDKADRSLSFAIGRGLKFLENVQNQDGGFGLTKERESNPHLTSFSLLALSKGGRTKENEVIKRALRFLENTQNEEGWWSYETISASESIGVTGLIVQAFQILKVSKTHPMYRAALNFLKRSFSDDEGCWRDNKFSEYGEISVNESAFNAIEGELKKNQLDKFKLLFRSRLNADDGYGWKLRSEMGDEVSDIENTGIALKILNKLNFSKEDEFMKKAIEYVISSQLPNYGFPRKKLLAKRIETAERDIEFDATSLAISGLIASNFNPYSKIIQSAAESLANYINEDGGWGDGPGKESDTDSTALAVIALIDASRAAVPLADIQYEFYEAKSFIKNYIDRNVEQLNNEIKETKRLNRLLKYYTLILITTLIIVVILFTTIL